MASLEKELKRYEKYLYNKKIAPHQHVRFFVGWVRRFLLFSDDVGDLSFSRVCEDFARKLENDGFKDWQVQQALDSVKIYHYQFGSNHSVSDERPASSLDLSGDPLLELRRLLRLRHYSFRTEKSYLA